MTANRNTDVLVVGAGPVGLLSALLLTERGLRVEIIDEQWRTAARSYALALHPSSLALLDELGLAKQLVAQGRRLDVLAFYRGAERQAEVRFDSLDTPFPFVLVLPQCALEEALESRLRDRSIQVHWNHRLASLRMDGDRPVAEVETLAKDTVGYGIARTEWVVQSLSQVTASFVVGADGYRSMVRRELGATFEECGSAERYAVFEFACDEEGPEELRVLHDDDGTSVLWPIGAGRFRWSFPIAEDETMHRRTKSRLVVQAGRRPIPHLGIELLQVQIAHRAPWFDGSVGEVAWSLAVRFEKRLASPFGRGRVWLAGDAAHVAGPVGVHSMNHGFAEARALSTRMHSVLREGTPLSVLDTYGNEARAPWTQLMGTAGPPATTADALPWVNQEAARIAPCIPASGRDLHALLGQVGVSLPVVPVGRSEAPPPA